MGGHGSGRYCRWSNTTTLEETKRIDIRFLRRNKKLRPYCSGALNWTRGGEPAGDIHYVCYSNRIVFNYRYRSNGSEWEPVELPVYFDRTPCRIGGERLWFLCPACRRRCEVLCLAGKYPACRKCYRLPYRSQIQTPLDRLFEKQRKLEAELWGENKKWYRQPRRERLEGEYERLNVLVEAELHRHFGYLNLIS